MKIRFWGTRGSNPHTLNDKTLRDLVRTTIQECKSKGLSSLDDLLKFLEPTENPAPMTYGGHTPCVEVTHGKHSFFVDGGTGIREAGTAAFGSRKEFIFFMTHLHWDHLMGFPFFVPVFAKGHRLIIYHVHKTAPDSIRNLFNGVNFPLTFNQLGAEFEFRHLEPYQTTTFDEVTVTPFVLDHPGGSFGYRFESGGKSLAVGFDGEYKRVSQKELGNDLPFYQELDLLVFDSQYELEELMNRFDWGHCSPMIGIDLALREGIRNLALIHHDPWATDVKLRKAHQESLEYLKMKAEELPSDWPHKKRGIPKVISAYDGLEIEV